MSSGSGDEAPLSEYMIQLSNAFPYPRDSGDALSILHQLQGAMPPLAKAKLLARPHFQHLGLMCVDI